MRWRTTKPSIKYSTRKILFFFFLLLLYSLIEQRSVHFLIACKCKRTNWESGEKRTKRNYQEQRIFDLLSALFKKFFHYSRRAMNEWFSWEASVKTMKERAFVHAIPYVIKSLISSMESVTIRRIMKWWNFFFSFNCSLECHGESRHQCRLKIIQKWMSFVRSHFLFLLKNISSKCFFRFEWNPRRS